MVDEQIVEDADTVNPNVEDVGLVFKRCGVLEGNSSTGVDPRLFVVDKVVDWLLADMVGNGVEPNSSVVVVDPRSVVVAMFSVDSDVVIGVDITVCKRCGVEEGVSSDNEFDVDEEVSSGSGYGLEDEVSSDNVPGPSVDEVISSGSGFGVDEEVGSDVGYGVARDVSSGIGYDEDKDVSSCSGYVVVMAGFKRCVVDEEGSSGRGYDVEEECSSVDKAGFKR